MRLVLHFFLVVSIAIIISQSSLIYYGIKQAYGQLRIVYNAEDISAIRADSNTPDSLIQKLDFLEEVKRYAVDSLGLKESENYTTIYDQKGEPVLWVVTGSKPYVLEPLVWKFPILGTVPYKGFFDREMAADELNRIKKMGYDAGVRTVGGWSTLGWFTDPILSNMLGRSDGNLANLIFHELVHATIFVKDSVEFNENLASFIADKATIKFIDDRYGENSNEKSEYLNEKHDKQKYTSHILRGVGELKKLYNRIEPLNSEKKQKLKNDLIVKIMKSADTLSFKDEAYLNAVKNQVPNNTYFLSFMRYNSKQDALEQMYFRDFNNNIKGFIFYLEKKHPYL